jgi:hypothetical protein
MYEEGRVVYVGNLLPTTTNIQRHLLKMTL